MMNRRRICGKHTRPINRLSARKERIALAPNRPTDLVGGYRPPACRMRLTSRPPKGRRITIDQIGGIISKNRQPSLA